MSWQKEHFRTLNAAYSSTPFFEHYINQLSPVFETQFDSLLELNKWTFQKVMQLLDLEMNCEFSEKYEQVETNLDYRLSRNENFMDLNSTYYQLNFDRQMPFIGNLSILDLLFNQGPEARLVVQSY